jgi:Phage virion morphogenesis family
MSRKSRKLTTGLQTLLAELSGKGKIDEVLTREIAKEIEASLHASIAAQRQPDGTPWPVHRSHVPPRPRDGGPVLLDAADHLNVGSSGTTVVVSLRGIFAKHHFGAVKGNKRLSKGNKGYPRRIIPYGPKIPEDMKERINRVLDKKWKELTKP